MQVAGSRSWGQRIAAVVITSVALWAVSASAQKTELLVYTALETDQIKAYEDAFYKAYPDVAIKWVRDSTGVITAKLLAEKANPQADGRRPPHRAWQCSRREYAQGCARAWTRSFQRIAIRRITGWVGMDVYGAAICFRTAKPETEPASRRRGRDLRTVYKGKIVMPRRRRDGVPRRCRAGCGWGRDMTRGSWTRARQHRTLPPQAEAVPRGGRR
jgi:iron(III) transport system substrate-binding protein